ncbi:hypothetical protein KKC83_06825 [Patescibacteria group bacterium]|nr:hypothetical protein [Desulfocapsa sp.]MBU3983277.1 hypothetical protein [Pseudomonadota bacterium]MBU4027227.1 hypothetical protein [Patescibacteria group bacterium]MCG2743200.1 hypothetical protein [Desulfobacteraceae bacterium]MBU4396220.1 hypothetical protein [Pseudomonadota bacterium]
MSTPNQTYEAARQILESVSDIHGALALAGQQELVEELVKIQKKAACIMQMERPQEDIKESCRMDMMNAIGCLAHVLNRNLDAWPNIDGDEVVSIIRLAEQCVRRGHAWFDRLAMDNQEDESQIWREQ